MIKWFERAGLFLAAVLILLVLGYSSPASPAMSTQANPMKANRQQFERIHEAVFYVYKGQPVQP